MTVLTSCLRHRAPRVLLGAFVVVLGSGSTIAQAQTGEKSAGEAIIVEPSDRSEPMSGGGSKSAFALRLPDDAACPGDSQDGSYRVQSFLVPASTDLGTLRFFGIKPVAENGWGLFRVNTSSYANELTDVAREPGGPGTIINLPDFTFSVFDPGMVVPGRYHLGLACTLRNETTRFWSTEIDIEEDSDDEPAAIEWTVVNAASGAVDDDGDKTAGLSAGIVTGLAISGAGIAAYLYVRRRRASVGGDEAP